MYGYENANKKNCTFLFHMGTKPHRNSAWKMNDNLLPYYRFTIMQETLSDIMCALQFCVYAIYARMFAK